MPRKKDSIMTPREDSRWWLAYKMLLDIYAIEGIDVIESDVPMNPFAGAWPKCSTKEHYNEWKIMARSRSPGIAGFCRDCTSEYQRRMIQEFKCEHPLVSFRLDDDGIEEGYLPRVADKE